MPKKPKDYITPPWIREDLKEEELRMPVAMVGALYQLQKDEQEVEYGGAVDFELVKGKPAVERILAYTGATRVVPGYVWEKVFMDPDIELTFHTHPTQDVAIPSESDIIFFLTTKPNAMLIVAGTEAILLTKGKETPPPKEVIEFYEDVKKTVSVAVPGVYRIPIAKKDQAESIRELKKLLDIEAVVFPMDKPIDITVKIVQEMAREGKKLMF